MAAAQALVQFGYTGASGNDAVVISPNVNLANAQAITTCEAAASAAGVGTYAWIGGSPAILIGGIAAVMHIATTVPANWFPVASSV